MIRWEAPGPYVVAFTTRNGGVSDGPFASLNLGLLTADDDAHVVENRRRLCAAVGAEPERLAMNRQVHGAVVHRAEAGERSRPGDGLWTDEERLPMLKLTADCLPIALVRSNGGARLALLHAGRLGLLEGVVDAGVAAVGPGPVAAAIGPGIGPCCYEVGDDIRDAYRARFGDGVVRGRKLDLWRAAELALRAAGVERVERIDRCTSCNAHEFFSHRRDAGVTGRQGVVGYVA
jgi:polyphenol oxidase